MRCKQGFHTVCFSVRKDLQQKDRYVADLAKDSRTDSTNPTTELNIAMNRLNDTLSSNGNTKQLQRQVNSAERKIQTIQETQTKQLKGINEIIHMLGSARTSDPS